MNNKRKIGSAFICDWEVRSWETFLVIQRRLWNRSDNRQMQRKKTTTWIIRFDCEIHEDARRQLTRLIKKARGSAQLRRKFNGWKAAHQDYKMEPERLSGL